MIAVVDYGMGNLRSVAKALEHVAPKESVCIAATAAQIDAADRIVFPGQGAMPDCMEYLRTAGLEDAVRRAAASKPLLAVCIGQQMLLDSSEESRIAGAVTPGLGLFAGSVIRFRESDMRRPDGARLKVPHMGWNRVQQTQAHPLWAGVADNGWFYFVHSYHVQPRDAALAAGTSDYGRVFTCVLARDNIFATQFHPEKAPPPV